MLGDSKEEMDSSAPPPRLVDMWELVIKGYITEDSVQEDGTVDPHIQEEAERRYLSDGERPQSAPTLQRPPWIPTSRRSVSFGRENKLKSRLRSQTPAPATVPVSSDDHCCICLHRKKTHAFAPCFHMCTCEQCSLRLISCPICRTQVISRHRIYT